MTVRELHDMLDWSVHEEMMEEWRENRRKRLEEKGRPEQHPEIESMFAQHDTADFRMLLLNHALRSIAEPSKTPDPAPTEGTCIAARRLLGPVWDQVVNVLREKGFFEQSS